MKGVVRKQTSGRPASFVQQTIRKRKSTPRGGVASKQDKRTDNSKKFVVVKKHDNCMVRTALAKQTFRETRRLSIAVSGSMRRQREQLVTLGKLDRAVTVKAEFNNVSRWAHHVPSSVPFTVEGLLKALVQGKVKPLYDVDGKHKAAAQPDESS